MEGSSFSGLLTRCERASQLDGAVPGRALLQLPFLIISMSEPLAPGMDRGCSLGMRPQEMVQNMKQGQHMLLVACELSLPNIVVNHLPNFFAAMLHGQEVCSERCCGDFGEVFVLCNGKHLLFGQTT